MKILNILSALTLSITFFFMCYISYLLLWPFKIVEIKQPLKVISISKEELVYEVDYCKYIDGPATVTRQLINHQIIFLPVVVTNLPKGCNKSERRLELPRLAPDTYRLRISTTYEINKLRSETFIYETEPFIVK